MTSQSLSFPLLFPSLICHRVWFPWLLEEKHFKGTCHFSTDKQGAMLHHSFQQVTPEELLLASSSSSFESDIVKIVGMKR